MAEGPRETCLETMRELLAGMSGQRFWGGAYNGKGEPTVVVLWKDTFQVEQYPFIGLFEVPGSQTGGGEGDTQERDEDLFRVELHCYVTGDNVTHPRKWAGRLNRDIKITLRAAARVGGNGDLEPLIIEVEFGPEELSYNDTHAYLVLPVTVHLAEPLAA